MRYKQDLAKFLSIADGARLIQERAGITEDEAREDIVAFVRDHASVRDYASVRWFRVIRGERRQCYRSDLPSGFLDSLTPNHIDWGTSIARRRSVYSPFTVEIEVKRDALSQLYPLLDDDGDREGSTIGAMEEEPTATKGPRQPRRKKPAKAMHDQEQKKTPRPRGGGRKKGSGSLADKDAPMLELMKPLIVGGKSHWAAAMEVAPQAAGFSNLDESKAKRLVARFKEWEKKHSV